ncbi:uncharacterized protein LOC107367364 [Tetranychus urticae]|uniref:FAS1 domain-containing protein n=1 Tax=Tetranychus urticae TaxID=32264 RepID=T1JQR5_TETUR|nr:uncharacterized protein LOC107367364 [Tetranychus urticae]
MFLQATLTFFISFVSLVHCVSHSINLPSKRPWTPLPVSHSRQVNHQASSSPLVLPSSPSSTVYLPEKKSSDVTFETNGKTYSIESSHFPTPIIEHHPNGATVGLDLPDSNIRLLLDIDQLGGKPVAQHIGLKVVEKNKKKQSQQSTDHKSEAVKMNHRQTLTSSSNSYGSSAASTSQNHQPQKGSLTASSSPQLTTVSRSSKIVSIPISTNYKIGYIRSNDLHSAIHHQIVHGKGGNQVSVLSANYANQLLHNHHRVNPSTFESNVLNKDKSNQGGFTSPRLEQGSFKPIESYSNQMNKFDGQVKINNTNSSIKRLNIVSTSKVALSSPVAAIKSKARINGPRETEQIKESLQQQQVNDEQINQNDFNESDMQIKFDAPTTISTNSRNQRSPKKLDKFEDVSEPTSTLNSGSSLDTSNDISNADQGFDNDDDDENNGESENITEDFNSRINNHKQDENKSAFDSEVIGKLTSVTNPPVNINSKLMRGSFSCETITESFTSSTDSSLDSIARSLGADMLLNLIPSSQSILQTLIDASTSGYTLFLPSNEALAKLPSTLINRWKSDSTALNTLWSSHFIDSQITLENLKSMNEVSLKSGSNQLQFGIFRNETYTVNGQPISIGNQRAPNNGIIHVIEGVLYPSADKDIMTTLKVCNKFDGFVTLAMGTGLASVLSRGGPYTVFVPSNEALQKIPEKDLQLVRSNMTALKDMLAYHVVPGLYYSSHLMDGQFINSLQSSLPIKVGVRVDRCSRRLVEVNMSPVYGTDIPASNGVIHVIDWIIKPNDNDWCDDVIFPR